MCGEIAVRKIPKHILDKYGLVETLVTRDGDEGYEVSFAFRHRLPRLPMIVDGEIRVVEWGNRDNKLSRLPRTGWVRQDSFEAGKWKRLRPERVKIPASFGREKGVWFPIREGMEGVVVRDEQDQPHCYMFTDQASEAYEAMTGHDRMPILLGGQVI